MEPFAMLARSGKPDLASMIAVACEGIVARDIGGVMTDVVKDPASRPAGRPHHPLEPHPPRSCAS